MRAGHRFIKPRHSCRTTRRSLNVRASVTGSRQNGPGLAPTHSTGDVMKLNEFLLAEFNREVERSRRVLARVPEGKYDWKPHEKSMIFGYLADLVATIPSWIEMQVTKAE